MVGSAGTAAKINTGPSVRRAGGGTGKGETGPGRGGASRCGAAAGGGRRCGAWRGNGTARSDERCGRARSVPAAASPFVWGRVSARGVRGDVRPRPSRGADMGGFWDAEMERWVLGGLGLRVVLCQRVWLHPASITNSNNNS